MKKTKLMQALLSCGLFMGLLGNAQADTLTTTFNVTANILNSCTISATDMNFGDVILSAGATSTSEININCPASISGVLRLDGGNHLSSGQRYLNQTIDSTENLVSYNLFQDSALTLLFDPYSSGPFGAQTFTTEGGLWTIPVYGEIPSQPNNKPSGLYTDIITATVDY